MKVSLKIYCCSMIFCCALPAFGGVSPKWTSGGANSFFFRDPTLYAKPGATSVLVYVGMSPGDPSWTGQTGYSTSDGTGMAGQDYTPVSGSLSFWGPEWQIFAVPINPGPVEKTVILHIIGATATLIIPAAPPSLTINSDTNGICLLWDVRYTNYVVETTTNLALGTWVAIGEPSGSTNGSANIKVTANSPPAFFRLRKQ